MRGADLSDDGRSWYDPQMAEDLSGSELVRGAFGASAVGMAITDLDLRVVRALAHRIIVLKDGQVVEEGEAERLTAAPSQPYTRALMAAAFDLRATGGTHRT